MLNVASYCRVSTDDNDQLNSLENQKRYFKEYIANNPEWQFAGIYADEGLSGTSTKKRTNFNKIIEESYLGSIDLIVTKEVSRFARNTVDTLSYTRKLKERGVGVIFINDNIDTRDDDGEFRLTIMASVAQEESRKTSSRVKWGLKRQMERGFVVGGAPFGYSYSKGVLTIKEEEAEIVRDIFRRYAYEGKGISVISKELIKEKTPVGGRIKLWRPQTVARVLCNEKYAGDLELQKTFVENFLDHKQEINTGKEKKYFFTNHHEPIIDRETWKRTKAEYETRSALVKEKSRYSTRYWCSGKIVCGECGAKCITRTMLMVNGRWRAWQCSQASTYGKPSTDGVGNIRGCTNVSINEKALMACVSFALKKINIFNNNILYEIQRDLQNIQNCEVEYTNKFETQVKNIQEKKEQLIDMYLDKKISADDLERMKLKYDMSISEIKKHISDINKNNIVNGSNTSLTKAFEQIRKILEQETPTTELYGKILNKIIMYETHDLDIYFQHISVPICIHYETKGKGDSYKAICTLRE